MATVVIGGEYQIINMTVNLLEVGANLWKQLHDTAKLNQIDDDFINSFAKPYAAYREHWEQLIKDYPVPKTNQYQWSVMIHNIVNVEIGKPLWFS